MVLIRTPDIRSSRHRSSGVTLIELLIAVSLSTVVIGMALALFKTAGQASFMALGRRDEGFQAQTLFNALSINLLSGGGIIHLEPGRLELLNVKRRRVAYQWQDSSLTVNGRAWPLRVAELKIEPMGPARPKIKDRMGFEMDGPWDLDSLDENHDGAIDFEELDRNHNGALEPSENQFIAKVSVTLTTVQRGIPVTQRCIVHPRNHVPAILPEEGDVESEDSLDITEP